MNKRLNQINERIAAIRAEVEGAPDMAVDQLQARNKELDDLLAERGKIEMRQGMLNKMPAPSAAQADKGIAERAAGLRETGEMRLSLTGESRAITLGNTAGLVKHTENAAQVNGVPFAQVSSIVDMVKPINLEGMAEYQVPYEKGTGTAEVTAEGEEAGGNADPEFGYADIKPVKLTAYGEISRECLKLTDVDYYSRVLESARTALRKKVAEYIVNGGSGKAADFVGIVGAEAVIAGDDVSITAIDDKTLRKIALNYGGEEGIEGNAVLFLSKADLIAFGDVRGTNEKKAVYEITPDAGNPNVGTIKDGGLSVRYCINSKLTELSKQNAGGYSMIYGVPTCYELGIFSDYTVRVDESYAFKRGMLAILGEAMVGGNVTVYRGFVRVKKGA